MTQGLSLACKFAPVSLYEQEDHNQRYNESYVGSYPFREFGSFSCICLGKEVIPAPSVACGTEEYIYKASERQEVVAYDKVFQIKDC